MKSFATWTCGEPSFHTGFQNVDRKNLIKSAREIYDITDDIKAGNITDTNNMINAISIFIAKKSGLKAKSLMST